MRSLLIGLAFASLAVPAFGQAGSQTTPSFPLRPETPRQFSLSPPPAAAKGLTAPGAGLFFRNWQDILKHDAESVEVSSLTPRGAARTLAGPGQCSVPLLRMPVPEHIDDQSVITPQGDIDSKIAIQPPPDCPPRTSQAEGHKRK